MLLVCRLCVPPKTADSACKRHAHHVVLRLLGGQCGTGRLGVEAQRPGFGVFGLETLAHDPGPQAPRGAELGDFFQQVVVRVEEERQLRGEVVHIQTGFQRGFHVGDAVGERESHFLHGGRAGLADVVARDGDGVPVGDFFGTIREYVRDQTHGRRGREDIGAAGNVFLQDVVLDGAAQLRHVRALAFGDGDVHGQQYGRRGVDGHRGGNFVERNLVKELGHVFDG